MKLLKVSFLLAAAAAANQATAENFNFTYSDSSGTAAHGSVTATAIGSGIFWANAGSITVTASTNITYLGTHALTSIPNTNGFTVFPALSNYWWDNKIYPPTHASALTDGVVFGGLVFGNVGVWTIGDHGSIVGVFSTLNGGTNHWSDAPYGTLTIGLAGSSVTDVPAWMSSISGANQTYNTAVTLAGLPLEGAHHRPMFSYDRMGKESQAWATGDFGSSSRNRDVHVTTGEAGINWNLGKSFLVGVAAGHGEQNADLAFDGSSSTKGDYGLVELDYRPDGTQWIVSLLGMVGSWEAKINRGYTTGGTTDYSFGTADLITRTARLRVDAPSLVTLGGFGFAPYASYSVTQTVVGAYAESGGAFPASFDEQKHNSLEGRLGVTAAKDLDAQTKLLLTVEAIHRFDNSGPALTGQDVTGGVSFSLPGTAPRKDYVRFGFDIDRKLNENTLLNLSAHTSTVGEEQDVSVALSVRRAF
jgi:hypothetical protein